MQKLVVLTESELYNLVEDACRKVVNDYFPTHPNVPNLDDEIFNTKSAAAYLSINEESVRKARRLGKLQGVRINERDWGFKKSDLDSYANLYSRKRS